MTWEKSAFIKLCRAGAITFLPTTGGSFLMQREANGDLRPPGGGAEPCDQGDLEATLLRELKEELKLTPAMVKKKLKFLGFEPREKYRGTAVFTLKDHGLKPGKFIASNDPDEIVNLVEARLDDPRYTGPMPDKLKKEASLPDSPFDKYVRKHYQEVGGSDQFKDFVCTHNRDDCDSGELHGVSAAEMERIGRLWRVQDKLKKVAHPLDSYSTPKPDNPDEVLTEGLEQYNPRTATDPNAHNPSDEMIYAYLRDVEDPNAQAVPSTTPLPLATIRAKSDIKYGSIAVDLDATLAHHDDTKPFRIEHIGKPIPKMLARVRQWIKDGEKVVIFTARASNPKNVPAIKAWLKEHGLEGLKITNNKTPDIHEIWDDKAVSVERNTGKVIKAASAAHPPSASHSKPTDAAQLPPRTGPEAIAYALQNLDMEKKRAEAQSVIDRGLKSKRPLAVETLGFLQGFQRSGLHPRDLMIHSVPVIPAQFRPYTVAGDVFVPGDANELYRDLINLRDLHGELEHKLGPAGAASHKLRVYDAAKALYGFGDPTSPKTKERGVSGFLSQITGSSPKFSFVHRKLLSRDMDYVGRGVVGVDPDLSMDEIGIPEEMAWKLYAPYVQRRLVRGGMTPAESVRHIRERGPQAHKMLDMEMTDRPVMYSRSPAWHKFSVVGGYPKRVEGNSIMVNPFITSGMGMDFDGDTANVHLTSTPEAVEDVKERLMPSKMLHSTKKRGEVTATPKQEHVLSLFTAQTRPARNTHQFKTEDDAVKAIQAGHVKLSDEVTIS